MKLEVGMYVITTDRMELGKIINFCKCEQCKERGYYEPVIDNSNMFISNYDKENSFHGYKFYNNPIDLIEVGDYVNGEFITEVIRYKNGNVEHIEFGEFGHEIKNKDIKTIVTKEQFSQMEYKVEE